ncbi:MAG: O-antigen ligase family protein [Verrucomicrobiota bacterium]|nr:O-antigen ligase family protein [Verrucomicrobiota bacterium]
MNRIPLIALLAALLLLTVAAAGMWTWALILAGVLLSVACAAALRQRAAGWRRLVRRPTVVEAGYLAVLLFLLVSAIPLPRGCMAFAGRLRREQNERVALALERAPTFGLALPAGRQVSPADRRPLFALARNRAGSWRAVALAIAVFSAAALSSLLNGLRRRVFLRLLMLLGGCVAAAGIVSVTCCPQGAMLWWLFPIPPTLPGSLACFVNPNHFAGFLAILMPAALLLGANDFTEQRWTRGALSIICLVLMLAGVLLSLSLGAALAGGIGLLAALASLARIFHMPSRAREISVLGPRRHSSAGTRAGWRMILVTLLLLLFGLLVALLAAQHPSIHARLRRLPRHDDRESLAVRSSAWQSALAAWRSYPLLGAGPDAFRMAHPQCRATSESGHMTHAENEYLQVLAETGAVGVALLAVLAVALARQARRALRAESRDSVVLGACAGALVAAAAHAGGDFALHVPLYAVVLAALGGLLLAPGSAEVQAPETLPARSAWAPIVGLAILAALGFAARPIRQRDSPAHLMSADSREAARALVWAPTSWHAWYCLGRHACLRNMPGSNAFGERCISQAAAYDPNNYRLWKELGMLRMRLGDLDGARIAFDRVRSLRDWVKLPALPETAP